MQDAAAQLLERRMKKHIAVILGLKEVEVDPYLPPEVAARLRSAVHKQFNAYYDVVLDVIRSLDNGTVELNDHYLNLLEEIHGVVIPPSAVATDV